ncbi:isoprenylcysteine carboxylmethyltransferase family protein [bacterium]|nr:isoprenylcysteine carboxylmethyltransferase family protein [bacterium]
MILSLALQLVTYLSFYFAIIFFFIKKDKKNLKFKLIQIFGAISIVLNLVFCFYNYVDFGVINYLGVFFISCGLAVFYLALYASRKHSLYIAFDQQNSVSSLLTTGIYSKVRHPFYLSYSLVWIGSPLSSGNIFLVLNLVPLLYLYVMAARDEEEAFLKSKFNLDYAQYMRSTKMFIPYIF